MTLPTILSARYANAAHTAAGLETAERGAVLASLYDTPDLWAHLEASSVSVAPFVDAALLRSHAARKRWAVETGGIVVSGIPVPTDGLAQTKLSGAAQAAAAGLLPATIKFKSPAGFVDLTPAQISGVYAALVAHIQACYETEAAVLAGIDAGTITTPAAIDAAAWPPNS